MSGLYISRTLLCEDKTLTEVELLEHEGVTVVLAEPGAGKTRLLSSISSRLGTEAERASIFKSKTSVPATNVLILDALDEVSKLDSSGIDAALVRAQETGARKVVLASRSSEWEEARSVFIRDCFGTDPVVVRLEPFDDVEQKELFLDYKPGENFSEFKSELERFELQSLLGNPQFLRLFADAFVQSGGKFTTKSKIFEDAVRRLACENNPAVSQANRPSIDTLIRWANEVFAKLLLSGATGVSIIDKPDERQFPHLGSLVSGENVQVQYLTDTRLLKPSTSEGEHEPVHRIVAEYCAARYLAERIDDSADWFSLRKCLAIIAPNSVVRDELRGLLGWMAAVGGKNLQEAAIDLDPYAVLANGDPSQLRPSSKRRLWSRLRDTAENDPYFRRGDIGRTFSTSGFFSAEDIEDIRPQLVGENENRHLKNLLLELIKGSDVALSLVPELRTLMLDGNNSLYTRLAYENLITIEGYDHKSDCEELIKKGSPDALYIATVMFQELGVETLGRNTLLNLFRQCAGLYLGRNEFEERTSTAKFFLKKFIRELELLHVEWLLDRLTENLICICGKEVYDCDCRTGVSKVVGLLLDRYFEESAGPFEPVRIWQWVKNLNFHEEPPQQSESVQALQTNHELRQGIQRYALGGVTDSDGVLNIWMYDFMRQSHAGLCFQPSDNRAMVDYAFENDNPALWSKFHANHERYKKEHAPNALRMHMRRQAKQKPEFMRVWAKSEHHAIGRLITQSHISHSRALRKMKRRKNRVNQIKSDNLRYLRENQSLVESGRHGGWLQRFAELYLMNPQELSEYMDDHEIPINALCNCLPFVEPELPTLGKLAELNCNSQGLVSETILYAACLAIFRRYGSLASVERDTLAILKTNIDMGYHAVDPDTRTHFEAEINKRLFQTKADVEQFAREYLEPQLMIANCNHAEVDWLRYKPEFLPLLEQLPLEWLTRFPGISMGALGILFDLAAEHSDQADLLGLIKRRYDENSIRHPGEAENEDLTARRSFWFLRYFFFSQDCPEDIKQWFKSDPDTIFELERHINPFDGNENKSWPTLSAKKVYVILDAFVEAWPKVCLPSGWGTYSPREETAYRFLTHIVWTIGRDEPGNSLPVLNAIIADERFGDFHNDARHMRASAFRQLALLDFKVPAPSRIMEILDQQAATVEVLRAQLLEELEEFQRAIKGSEFDPVEKFYSGGKRVDEPIASKRIAEHLQMRLSPLNIDVTPERHLKGATRCDITAAVMLDGVRKLLVIEVKGQWNPQLFTAAEEQLHQKYSIHPDAEQQGIYLVLWFGGNEKIAGKGEPSINSPIELKKQIIERMPAELRGLIDVFVLDLSRK